MITLKHIAALGLAATLLSSANATVLDLGTNGSGTINGALFLIVGPSNYEMLEHL